MLEQLTSEQEVLMEQVANEWLDRFFSGKTKLDEERAEKAIKKLYQFCELPNPEVVFVDSPLAIQFMAHLLKNGYVTLDQVSLKQVRDKVGDKVWDKVRDKVWDKVGDKVRDKVRDKVGAKVGDKVRDKVGAKVWDKVWAKVGAKVGDKVWAKVGAKVWDKVGNEKIEFEEFSYWYGGGNVGDYGWLAFHDFFNRIGIHEDNDQLTNDLLNFMEIQKSGVYDMVQFENVVIACGLPISVKTDDRDELSAEDDMAVEWSDGYGEYAIGGIFFTEDEWEKWRHADGKDVLKIPNTDQRAAIIKAQGSEKIVKDCGGKVIGKDEYGEVLELEGMLDGNGNPYRFLRALDPAHDQKVYIRIPPTISDPAEAEAWSYKLPQGVKYAPAFRT